MDGFDTRLRALPQPQVRPVYAKRVLSDVRVLQPGAGAWQRVQVRQLAPVCGGAPAAAGGATEDPGAATGDCGAARRDAAAADSGGPGRLGSVVAWICARRLAAV